MATATAKKPTTTKAPGKFAAPAPAKETQAAPQVATKEQKADPTPTCLHTTLVEALTSGAVQLFKVRAYGTRRSLPYLTVGSEDRKAAEDSTGCGRSPGQRTDHPGHCPDLRVSIATPRRFLTNLQNAQGVEAGKHNDKWTPGTKEVVIHTVHGHRVTD